MKIALTQITSEGFLFKYSGRFDQFNVLKELVASGDIHSFSPIMIEATLTAKPDFIEAAGKVTTLVGMDCSRCLKPFTYELHQKFLLRFSQQIPQDISSEEDEDLELTADQVGLIYIEGGELDLHDVIQEQIVLALPYKPLCSEACKGLCPKCGTDLNDGKCTCGNNGSGSPFDVLKNLKLS